MLRGSVITGTVLDHVNQPAAQITVNAMRYVSQNGERRLTRAGNGADRNALLQGDHPPSAITARISTAPNTAIAAPRRTGRGWPACRPSS